MRSKAELGAAIGSTPRAVLVVNVRSRRADRVGSQLTETLRNAGIRLLAEFRVTDPNMLAETLDQATAMAPDLLIVGGGDGTMAAAAERLAQRDTALGVLPLGTTNNFARSLGLPLDLAGAIHTIAYGIVADIDLGMIRNTDGQQRLFANMASLGLSVQVAAQTPSGLKRKIGRTAYALTAARLLPLHQPFLAHISTSDGDAEFWTHQLNVANGRSHWGHPIASDASIDDRLLVTYRLGDQARRGLSLAMLRQVIHGRRQRLAATPFLVTPELTLATRPALDIDVDGEIWGRTPVTISVAPNALRVVVTPWFIDT